MEPSSLFILIAIVLLGISLLGGGTMVYCCHGWERGLPFLSIRDLIEALTELDKRTTQRYRDLVRVANEVTIELRKEADSIPSQLLLKEMSTIVDMKEEEKETFSVGCQSAPAAPVTVMVAPATNDVVIFIPDK